MLRLEACEGQLHFLGRLECALLHDRIRVVGVGTWERAQGREREGHTICKGKDRGGEGVGVIGHQILGRNYLTKPGLQNCTVLGEFEFQVENNSSSQSILARYQSVVT